MKANKRHPTHDVMQFSFSSPAEDMRVNLERLRAATAIPDHMQRQMQRTMESLRAATAIPDHMQRQMQRTMESLRAATAIPDHMQRQMQRTMESLRAATAIPDHMQGEMQRTMESLRAATAIPDHMQGEMQRIMESLRAVTAIPDHVRQSLETLATSLAVEANLATLWEAWRQRPLTTLRNYVDAFRAEGTPSDLHIQSDGSVVIDGELVTSQEMNQAVEALLEEPETLSENLRSRLDRLRKPLRRILSFFLENILLGFIQIALALYLDHKSTIQFRQFQDVILRDGERTRGEIRSDMRELRQTHQDFSEWRVVIANTLNVRERPTTKAATTDRLQCGAPVRLLERRRRWSRIEYESPKTATVEQGWVYGKYLKRIR